MTQIVAWSEVIEEATSTKSFSQAEKSFSGDPSICAVGERALQLGVPHWSAPSRIHRLGMDFMYAVQADEVDTARRILGLVRRWGARWSATRLKKEQRENRA